MVDTTTCELTRVPPTTASGRISVVIPTLDEEARIGKRLDELARISGIREVIVVDGGSRDRTVELVRARADVRVIMASQGRASQMNAGAREATGEVLLFLHADVSLPADAARWIDSALGEREVVAGAFRTWTVCDAGRSWLAPFLHLADLRSRYTGLPYGDQAIFVRASAFRRAGGFPEQALMEDLELARTLRRLGAVRTVPAVVRVSGRRFLARPIYYTVLVNVLPVLYRLGLSTRFLARFYGQAR